MSDTIDNRICVFDNKIEVLYSDSFTISWPFNVAYYKNTQFELYGRHIRDIFLQIIQKGKIVLDLEIGIQIGNRHNSRMGPSNGSVEVQLYFPEPRVKQLQWTTMPIDLMNNEAFCDLLINVDCNGQEKATFKASKAILAAHSSYFRLNFESNFEEAKTGVLTIKDFSPEIIEILLKFLYTCNLELDEDEDKKVEQASKLVSAAHRYEVQLLRLLCEDILQDSINEETSIDVLLEYILISYLYECPALKLNCLTFMREHLKEPNEEQTKMIVEFSKSNPDAMTDVFVKLLSF